MLEQINYNQIKHLNSLKLSLSHLKYLEELYLMGQVPDDKWSRDLSKFGMYRDGEITDYGKDAYVTVVNLPSTEMKVAKKKVKKEVDERFMKWWEAYPKHASHGKWVSTRSLRVKADECEVKFLKILEERKYTLEDMIRVLELEVRLRKEQSEVRQKNELEFMKATASYLNSKQYEVFMEFEKKNEVKSKLNVSI